MKLTVPLDKSVTITVTGYEPFECLFAQPLQRDVNRRADLNVKMVPFNPAVGRANDVFFLLRECGINDDEDKPLWHPTRLKNHNLGLPEFMQGWEKLPPEIADAIWEASLEVSPAWDWRGQSEEGESFREWDTST